MSLDMYDEKSISYQQTKRLFTEFLDSELSNGVNYIKHIADMINNNKHRLLVNVNDIRLYNSELCTRLLNQPMSYIGPFTGALNDYINSRGGVQLDNGNVIKATQTGIQYNIGLTGEFGTEGYGITPRDLNSRHLNTIQCVSGIATRCSIVRPKVQKTVHYCSEENIHTEQQYHDITSLNGLPTGSMYPTTDSNGHVLSTEFGLSQYMDHQTMLLHEMPEKTPAGLLPSSVDVILDDDLVDTCKPGDRIQIIGIYRSIPSKQNNVTNGLFRTVLIANHIRPINRSANSNTGSSITDVDIKNIRKLGKNKNVFDILASSIAPSISGHSMIKKALILQMLGGIEKNLDNGTHIRGDINILMCGDPSTAKSQLLRFILSIAPLAINTTGRGSSGVGLTAAVLTDRDTGERRLEAGAMVLGDRGIVCIDEFDKMSDNDRVAIHEVMEQQTVTIAKAGIHMSLNARCSVLAAANPRYSQYDSTHTPAENVALPDSLLSRFDLLFIVLDTPDKDKDGIIADRVIQNHRYVNKNNSNWNDDDNNNNSNNDVNNKATPMYVNEYHNNNKSNNKNNNDNRLTVAFLKKYIEFAKSQYIPVLTDEAVEFIAHTYTQLRNNDNSRNKSALPVTARTLETMIRLSTAHAKLRLSDEIMVGDCVAATEIMFFALQNDTQVVKKNNNKYDTAPGDIDESTIMYNDEQKENINDNNIQRSNSNTSAINQRQGSKRTRTQPQPPQRIIEDDSKEQEEQDNNMDIDDNNVNSKRARHVVTQDSDDMNTSSNNTIDLSPERINLFKRLLGNYLSEKRLDDEQLDIILLAINDISNKQGHATYTFDEAENICQLLSAQNLIMWSNSRVWRI